MKKAIFSTEINLLRSTMQRLLRRSAHTNIAKILRTTHQADVALIMRNLNQYDQNTIFSIIELSPNGSIYFTTPLSCAIIC